MSQEETFPAFREESLSTGAELMERVAQKLSALDRTYEQFVTEAAEASMDKDAIKATLISAWNAGALPRVVPSGRHRGSGVSLSILHGEVPTNIFDYFSDINGFSGVTLPKSKDPSGSTIEHASVVFINPSETLPTTANPDDPSAFYVDNFTLPQLANDSRFDPVFVAARLAQVDELLPSPAAQ